MFCLPKAEASRPCRKCRLPAVPVSSFGSRNSPSGASIGATPSRIHRARSANSRSIAAARTCVLAVTSGVSTDSIRTGIRMFGVSPSVTSTSARAPSDGMVAPTGGDQKTCTASIIFTPRTSSAIPEDQSTTNARQQLPIPGRSPQLERG